MMNNDDLIDAIRAALDTDETGEALVEVARRAHDAERMLARVHKVLDGLGDPEDDSEEILSIMKILGRNDG